MANQPSIQPSIPTEVLKQLAPLQQPDPISTWPMAAGWWLLGGLTLLAIVLIGCQLWRQIRRRRYRKQATHTLSAHWQHYQAQQNLPVFSQACNQLLKQVAITAYGREVVASLTGQAWYQFLLMHHPNNNIQVPEDYFVAGQYAPQPAITADQLKDFTHSWINHHHA